MVCQRDPIRAGVAADAPQRLVARAPRGGLHALAPRARQRRHVHARDAQGHAQRIAQRLAESHVCDGRRAAQAVLDVRGSQREREPLARLREQAQQRHGVRAARDSDEQMTPPRLGEIGQFGVTHETPLHNTLHYIGKRAQRQRISENSV